VLVVPTPSARKCAFLGTCRLKKTAIVVVRKPSPVQRCSPCITVVTVSRCVCCSIVAYRHCEAAVLVSPTLSAQTRAFLGPRRLEKPPSSWSQKPSPARRSSPCIAVLVVFRCVSCFTVAYHHYETALLVAPTPSARKRGGQSPLQATANEVKIMR
jgi:hypothetical protein